MYFLDPYGVYKGIPLWVLSDFHWQVSWNFRNIFLPSSKKYFLSELRKILGYSYDVKSSNLSIYEVFRTIGAPQIRFPDLASFISPNCPKLPWIHVDLAQSSELTLPLAQFLNTSKAQRRTFNSVWALGTSGKCDFSSLYRFRVTNRWYFAG